MDYAQGMQSLLKILLKSKRSALRVMEGITRYLEEILGLPVNREKSEVALMREVTFLGFRIYRLKIRVSDQSIAKFKRRIHELTHRNNPKSMKTIIKELNRFLRGWANYFRIQEFKTSFGSLDDWLRGRLRSMQLAKWKKPKKFQRAMITAGVPVWRARRAPL